MFSNNQPSGINNPLQNFRFSQQPEMKPLRQVELEVRLEQLKGQSNDNSNPYYDNSYKNNRDIYRENNARELKNSTPIQSQRPPINQSGSKTYIPEEPSRTSAQNAIKGSFFDNFGEDKRHNNIQNEYRAYVRKLNSRDFQPSEIGGFYKNNQSQDDTRRDRSNGRGRKAQSGGVNQKEDWYIQNYNVGILPGMGKTDGARVTLATQKTMDISPMQERYSNPQNQMRTRENEIRDDNTARMSAGLPGRGGSRLADAGSRIVDGDDFRGFGSRLDQIKVPDSFGDYGNLEQRKEIYNNVQYSKSPQYNNNRSRELMWNMPDFNRKKTADFDGIINEQDYGYGASKVNRAESINDFNDWKANALKKSPETNPVTSTNQNQNQRYLPTDDGGEKNGTSWLKQRESQDVDKKQKQREELQKVYREQMEEKKRKKDEEKRKQMLEDQKEEDRLRRENEELQRQFALELQKKKEQETAKENAQADLNKVVEDFTAAANKRKQNKYNKAFDTSEENSLRRDVVAYQPEPNNMPEREIEYEREVRYDPPPRRLEDLVKETAKFVEDEARFRKRVEFSQDPEMEVHKAVMRRIDATLDEQLDKMKKDLSLHTQLIRDSQSVYKQQAMVSSELRQNAQKDLLRLREDLRMQQVEEEQRPFHNLNMPPPQDYSMKQHVNHSASNKQLKLQEKPGVRLGSFGNKNYSKMQPIQSYDNHDVDLGGTSALGMTLDVDTHYVPVKGLGDLSLETSRAGESQAHIGYDAAKNKFDSYFPEHKTAGPTYNDAQIEHNYLASIKSGGGIEQNEHRYNYIKGPTQVRQYDKPKKDVSHNNDNFGDVEGADEIERLDNLLKRYKENTRQQREEEDRELDQETDQKPLHHTSIPVASHTRIQEKLDYNINENEDDLDLGAYELPDRDEQNLDGGDELNVATHHVEVNRNLHVEA